LPRWGGCRYPLGCYYLSRPPCCLALTLEAGRVVGGSPLPGTSREADSSASASLGVGMTTIKYC
jgi:hypothetical protein